MPARSPYRVCSSNESAVHQVRSHPVLLLRSSGRQVDLLILGAPRTQGRGRRRRFLWCGAVQL